MIPFVNVCPPILWNVVPIGVGIVVQLDGVAGTNINGVLAVNVRQAYTYEQRAK